MDLLIALLFTMGIGVYRISKYGTIESAPVAIVEESGVVITDSMNIPVGRNIQSKKEFHAFEKILQEFGL